MRLLKAGSAALLLVVLAGCSGGAVEIPADATANPNPMSTPPVTPTITPSDAAADPLAECIARSGFTLRPPDLDTRDPAARAKRTDDQLRFDIIQAQCHQDLDPTATPTP
ncbi:hypothetical protein HQQ80_04760 [Microbacteriaceae bacterium VKM Ac-2855]|nr:hypothetical protein [Microbacteriaceae bacterium VKM Ac-2855]